jgi:polyferredoxin
MSVQSPTAVDFASDSEPFDLLRIPVIGKLLSWRHSRTLMQIPTLMVAVVMIVHGLFGPSLAPKNLATTLGWVQFRGVLVLVLLGAGNFFCFACPFMLVRDAARRFFQPVFNWPRRLRNKWLSVGLFVAILFSYELFGLWSSPWWTAWLIVAYFVGALAIDGIFKHASFCKFVCPIGQFNFVASLVSPLEVRVRNPSVCSACSTKDCIKGRRAPTLELVVIQPNLIQRGCELALFQPLKFGNMDCTFCLDCVHACPHDNVGILNRPVTSELTADPMRSGIGHFSRRRDISALVTVFTFGALVNAFGMVSPVYALERWLSRAMHVSHVAPALGLIFGFVLIVEPVFLLGLAAWATKRWSGSRLGLLPLAVRYSYGLVPLGFGMWLAHYGYHFLTGMLTVIPVVQNAAASFGYPFLGEPRWRLTGMPANIVLPLEVGVLVLALAATLILIHRMAEEDSPESVSRAFAPWAAVGMLVWCAALWLILQPMDMRGTFMAG